MTLRRTRGEARTGGRRVAALLAITAAIAGTTAAGLPALADNGDGAPVVVPGGPPLITPGSIVRACKNTDGSVTQVVRDLAPPGMALNSTAGPVVPANLPC
jgi:hypothetical protein